MLRVDLENWLKRTFLIKKGEKGGDFSKIGEKRGISQKKGEDCASRNYAKINKIIIYGEIAI